jgi:translocation and assembly module TamA
MRTLARNDSAKQITGAQVSDKSGDGFRFLCIPRRQKMTGVRAERWAYRLACCLAVLLLCCLVTAHAADPQAYKVDLVSTGNSDLNATLKATSELVTLRTSAPVGPFALIGRARSDLDRLKTVLESYGYYQSYVGITIDDLPLDDPALGDELTSKPKGADARVKVTFTLGSIYHLRHITIDGELPKSVDGKLALNTGAPAVADQVLAAGERLQTALEDEGYAFAKVDPPVAQEIPAERVLDVSFHVSTGARVSIGTIQISGLKRMKESFVRRRLLVHTGELYGASKIERARKDLLALGVFTSVTVQVGEKPDSAGQVPITFTIRERLLHAVSLSAAYSTDLGGSSGVTWTQRDMSGRADSLTLGANVLNLGGSASDGVGYDLTAKYMLPELGHRDQSLQLAVEAINQSLAAYDQKAITFGATLTRKLSPVWSVSVGATAEVEHIQQEGYIQELQSLVAADKLTSVCPQLQTVGSYSECLVSGTPPPCTPGQPCTEEIFTTALQASHYELLALPMSVSFNTTGLDSPLEDATHGIRASLSEAPTLSIGTKTAKYFITQGNLAYYFDLNHFHWSDPGRSVIALRGLAGLADGASQYSLPPDQRFYAGGSGTVRGYRYQTVGPLFPDGNPIGGTAINAGQAEYRQRIGQSLGFVVFLDAGQVSKDVNPLDSTLRFGTGAGVRYYTAIGPIRLDIGLPINRPTEPATSTTPAKKVGDAFEIYIGLGQSF